MSEGVPKNKKGTLRTCKQGHQYVKSSDCPVCPVCEAQNKPRDFLSYFSAPARRALENAGIGSKKQLAAVSRKDLLKLHGFGPSSLPIVEKVLKDKTIN